MRVQSPSRFEQEIGERIRLPGLRPEASGESETSHGEPLPVAPPDTHEVIAPIRSERLDDRQLESPAVNIG